MAVSLILATWVFWVLATWGIGLFLVSWLVSSSKVNLWFQAQFGIWIGFFVLVALTVSLNFFAPMVGVLGEWCALGWIVLGIALLGRWVYSSQLGSASFTLGVFSEMYKEQTDTCKNCVAKSRVRSIPLRT